jgi:hypothetical protein
MRAASMYPLHQTQRTDKMYSRRSVAVGAASQPQLLHSSFSSVLNHRDLLLSL